MKKGIALRKYIALVLLAAALLLGGCDWLANPPLTADESYLRSQTQSESASSADPQRSSAAVVPLTQTAPEPVTQTAPEPVTNISPGLPGKAGTADGEISELRFMSVGDNLIHDTVINAGKQADGSYDFNMLFDGMREYFAQADLACINQETIFTADPSKYGGYPLFGTPTMVGDAIAAAGFDIVLHASNHALDKTSRGVLDTLSFWKNNYPEMIVLGISESKEEYESIEYAEFGGIKFAFFNYTYGTNGMTPPDDKPWLVSMLDSASKSKIKQELETARKNADIVVVYPHWGSEYVYKPDDSQKSWTKLFADCGVDIVIGAHPHVLQPMELVERTDGGTMVVYYSVGNYCSHQDAVPRMLGGVADIVLCKQGDSVWVKSAELVPIVTQIQSGYFTTYLLSEYTDALAKAHKFNGKFGFDEFNPEVMWKLYTKITGFDKGNMGYVCE